MGPSVVRFVLLCLSGAAVGLMTIVTILTTVGIVLMVMDASPLYAILGVVVGWGVTMLALLGIKAVTVRALR